MKIQLIAILMISGLFPCTVWTQALSLPEGVFENATPAGGIQKIAIYTEGNTWPIVQAFARQSDQWVFLGKATLATQSQYTYAQFPEFTLTFFTTRSADQLEVRTDWKRPRSQTGYFPSPQRTRFRRTSPQLNVRNLSSSNIDLYTYTAQQAPQLRGTLAPNQRAIFNSQKGQIWEARDRATGNVLVYQEMIRPMEWMTLNGGMAAVTETPRVINGPIYRSQPTPEVPETSRSVSNSQTDDYQYHKINTGETISQIARKYGISIEHLRQLNPDIPPSNLIRTGSYILIRRNQVARSASQPVESAVPRSAEPVVVRSAPYPASSEDAFLQHIRISNPSYPLLAVYLVNSQRRESLLSHLGPNESIDLKVPVSGTLLFKDPATARVVRYLRIAEHPEFQYSIP